MCILSGSEAIMNDPLLARISFFNDMVQASYPASLWSYDDQLEEENALTPDAVLRPRYFSDEYILSQLLLRKSQGQLSPLILEYRVGIRWIAAFEPLSPAPENPTRTQTGSSPSSQTAVNRIWFLGPYLSGNLSTHLLRKGLQSYDLSPHIQRQMLTAFDEIPSVSQDALFTLAIQLHCLLTHQTLPPTSVRILSAGKQYSPEASRKASEREFLTQMVLGEARSSYQTSHSGIRQSELLLLDSIRNGNLDYKQLLSHSMRLSSGIKSMKVPPLRLAQDSGITLLALVSRAAIEGGLPADIAYDMNDRYLDSLEQSQDIEEVQAAISDFLDDFVQRIYLIRNTAGISHEILEVCHYIEAHLSSVLTAANLAPISGYSPYYFSDKFQREMKIPLTAYIREKRLARAARMLKETTATVTEVAAAVGMESRSYFSVSFKRKYGMSPAHYRKTR